jgi:hypothetical protein
MAVNRRDMDGLQPADVWAVLSDGESYGYWVVGTRAVREVHGAWPAPGTSIHYVVGHAPVRKDDHTVSRKAVEDHRLELEAHAWPVGTLFIGLTVERSPRGVTVTIEEHPERGILKRLNNPLIDLAIKVRNVETLRRLEKAVRERAAEQLPRP